MCLDIAWTWGFVDTNTNFKYVSINNCPYELSSFFIWYQHSVQIWPPPPIYWQRCFWKLCSITLISMDLNRRPIHPAFQATSLYSGLDAQMCVWYTVAERCTECTTLPLVVHQLVWINILHVSSLWDYPRACSILITGTIIHIQAANMYQLSWLMLKCRQLISSFQTDYFSICEKIRGWCLFFNDLSLRFKPILKNN